MSGPEYYCSRCYKVYQLPVPAWCTCGCRTFLSEWEHTQMQKKGKESYTIIGLLQSIDSKLSALLIKEN